MVAKLRRKANVAWIGSVKAGSGDLKLASKAAPQMTISLDSRQSEGAPSTSPEELLAASHASCFAMSVRSVLDGMVSEKPSVADANVQVEATCILAIDGPRWTVEEMLLAVSISGLAEQEVSKIIDLADERCPISAALRKSVRITKFFAGGDQ